MRYQIIKKYVCYVNECGYFGISGECINPDRMIDICVSKKLHLWNRHHIIVRWNRTTKISVNVEMWLFNKNIKLNRGKVK